MHKHSGISTSSRLRRRSPSYGADGAAVQQRRWRKVAAAAAVGLLGAPIAACSSSAKSGTSSPPSTTGSATVGSGASGNLISQSEQLLSTAQTSPVYAQLFAPDTSDISNAVPTDFQAVKEWVGPTAKVVPPRNKRVVLVGIAGTACQTAIDLTKKIIDGLHLGWTATTIEASGSSQSFVTSMNSALAENPQMILGYCVPDIAVQQQLAEANSRHIITIAAAGSAGGSEHFDGYMTSNAKMVFALMAFTVIGDSHGTAHALVIHDSTFASLDQGSTQFEAILRKCSGCKTYPVQWTVTEGSNPVQAQQIISAALSSHPDANYVVLPYDTVGLPSVVAAVRGATTRGIKIVVKDASPAALNLVSSGQVAYDPGVDLTWTCYAIVDQLIRAAAGATLITEDHQGVPIELFGPNNVPNGDLVDLSSQVDYKAIYAQLWSSSS